jgi:protein-lysine N-methyltransferase EEF2KMT
VLLDSDDLVHDPEGALTTVCNELGFPFRKSMMTWPSGPHACDGPWARWWYEDVHKSSGWKPQTTTAGSSSERLYRSLDPNLMSALKISYPAYQFLKTLTAGHRKRGPPPNEIYEDPRNEHLLAYIGAPGRGRLIPRDAAGVSPWDSSVQGGDAAWEGVRVYRGKILSLEEHLKRLFRSAKALGFRNVHTKDEIVQAIFRTLAANGMRDGAHMRLTLTRGEKCTSSMNPVFNVYGTTLIILAEWKPTEGATTYDNTAGISLITASQRRNPPHTVDSKIHHNNLINNILPKIQANLAGCADAIMLDVEGYVSETNATNIFMVQDGVLCTPAADHCLPGITRATVLDLAKELQIPTEVRRISLSEFHAADEVFTTGTMGGLTPVTMIDGRVIGTGTRGPITMSLQELYKALPERDGWATPIPEYFC